MKNNVMKLVTLSAVLLMVSNNVYSMGLGEAEDNTTQPGGKRKLSSELNRSSLTGSGSHTPKTPLTPKPFFSDRTKKNARTLLKDWVPTLAVLGCVALHTYKNDRKLSAKAWDFVRKTVSLKQAPKLLFYPVTALVGFMGYEYYKPRVERLLGLRRTY